MNFIKGRILVQTDHESDCDFLRQHLVQLGHEVWFVDDYEDLLKKPELEPV